MSASLVLVLWPSSLLFTGVLCFRVGVWWKGIHLHGRHEFVPRRAASRSRHRDDDAVYRERDGYSEADEADPDEDAYLGDDASWLPGRAAAAPEGRNEDAPEEPGEVHQDSDRFRATDAETVPMERPPAATGRHRWRGRDDDTEVLPRLQDVRPPSRATPIRRPPWLR